VLVLEDDTQYDEARTELRRIGLDRVSGYLQGGLPAWLAAGERIATIEQLDVHGQDEWESGHIAGAEHRFAGLIAGGKVDLETLLDGGPLAVICGSGYRSSVVASLLQRAGRADLLNVIGGMEAWQAAGLETT
jgi:hydroxyacylglutathione hydrolase